MKALSHHLRSFFHISSKIRQSYWEDTLSHNRRSLLVASILIIVLELYNIARVLLLSSARLSTLNNRIYFTFYLVLLGIGVVYLILSRLLRHAARPVRWAVQYIAALLMMLWHTAINIYDLYQVPDGATTIFTTALWALIIFVQMPPQFSLPMYLLAYGLFLPLSGPSLSSGDRVNLTITVVVALSVSMTMYHNTKLLLSQQHKLDRINRRLQAMVELEPLTGLLNTAALQKRAEALLAAREPVSLIIVDMDDFKGINDNLGHPCGDYVLQQVALALRSVFPNAHGIGRIGGDEFAVVIGLIPREELHQKARKLQARLGQICWQGQSVGVCCTLGVCQGEGALSYEELYRQADQVLYQAKEAGKSRCLIGDLIRPEG